MDGDVRSWFDGYLVALAASGRGDADTTALRDHYAAPLLVTSDAGVVVLTEPADVLALLQQQVDAMRATDYHHSDIVDFDATALNATTNLVRATLSRKRADGDEIGRLTVTYLVADTSAGRRIVALVPHGA